MESITSDAVQLKEVSIVPAGTGFIVNGTENVIVKFKATDKNADDVTNNKLMGILSPIQAPANAYVLSTKNDQTGFYPVSTSVTLPAHKAYLLITSGGARQLVMPQDGVTAVNDALQPAETTSNSFYTLQGVRVGRFSKGIYVKNGKLIIIK